MNGKEEAQINLRSLEGTMTGHIVENIKFLSTDKNLKKSPDLLTLHFYTLLKITFMLCCC